jgi:uncharacterized protein (DUF2461 family)
MLTNDTLKFLKELSKNNNKEWFEKNRKRYENAQTEIKSFIEAWINNYGNKDESIAHLDPKNVFSESIAMFDFLQIKLLTKII